MSDKKDVIKEPVLELELKNVWIHKRVELLISKINMRNAKGFSPPPEWYKELSSHLINLNIEGYFK